MAHSSPSPHVVPVSLPKRDTKSLRISSDRRKTPTLWEGTEFVRDIVNDDVYANSPGRESAFEVIMGDGSRKWRTVSLTSSADRRISRFYQARDPGNNDTELLSSPESPLSTYSYQQGLDSSDSTSYPTTANYSYIARERIRKCFAFLTNRCRFGGVTLSLTWRRTLKASLAYTVATCFTLNSDLRAWTGPAAHFVAVATMFFHPARTLGAQTEAFTFGFLGVLFGATFGLIALTAAAACNHHNYHYLGHAVCIGLMFVATFLLAFCKARFPSQTAQTGNSLAHIVLFVLLTREGSDVTEVHLGTLKNIVRALLIGSVISLVSCWAFWPESAGDNLRNDIHTTIVSFRVLLRLLVKAFLMDPDTLIHPLISDTMPSNRKFNTQSSHRQYRRRSVPAERTTPIENAKQLEFALQTHRSTFENLEISLKEARREVFFPGTWRYLTAYADLVSSLAVMGQRLGAMASGVDLMVAMLRKAEAAKASGVEGDSNLHTLLEFVDHVGPPMRALAYTCKQALIALEAFFGDEKKIRHDASTDGVDEERVPLLTSNDQELRNNAAKLREALDAALELFSDARKKAVSKLHRIDGFDGKVDEHVFLVYFFLFSLQEFAHQLGSNVVAKYQTLLTEMADHRKKKYRWPWRRVETAGTAGQRTEAGGVRARTRELVSPTEGQHTPKPKTYIQKLAHRAWQFLMSLRQFKFAFKVAVTLTLMAAPSFFEPTRSLFTNLRGEWALISTVVCMSPTVGGSNSIALYRLLATFAGVSIAYLVHIAVRGNAYAMALVLFCISVPCFWMTLNTRYPRIGQFALLACTTVVLQPFGSGVPKEVLELAWKRGLMVSVGILAACLVTWYWWPYEARVELRKGLADFLEKTSYLYSSLVASYSSPNSALTETQFLKYERDLQTQHTHLRELLSLTPHEPRLKGPYPVATYTEILSVCQRLLDRFLAMRIAVSKEDFTLVRSRVIAPLNEERREVVGIVCMYLWLLSSAFLLKKPMPAYLPAISAARDRLFQALQRIPNDRQRPMIDLDDGETNSTGDAYVYFLAYIAVMDDVARSLDRLGSAAQTLFGTVVEVNRFDAMFQLEIA